MTSEQVRQGGEGIGHVDILGESMAAKGTTVGAKALRRTVTGTFKGLQRDGQGCGQVSRSECRLWRAL